MVMTATVACGICSYYSQCDRANPRGPRAGHRVLRRHGRDRSVSWTAGGVREDSLRGCRCGAVEALATAGTLSIIGVYPGTMQYFPVGAAMMKNLTVNMGNCNHRKYLPKLVDMVASNVIHRARVLTQVEPLTSVIEAYEAFDRGATRVASKSGRPRRNNISGRSIAFPLSEVSMPEKKTVQRARKDKREGKSASTQAGEFVREEMDHIREGKHGARSTKQAIAIGLSKARRAGVDLPPPKKGRASAATRHKAEQDVEHGRTKKKTSSKRSSATKRALKREPHEAASLKSISRHSKQAARKKSSRSK